MTWFLVEVIVRLRIYSNQRDLAKFRQSSAAPAQEKQRRSQAATMYFEAVA